MSSLYGNVVKNTRVEYVKTYQTQEEMMAGAQSDGVPAGYTVLCVEDHTVWQKIINTTNGNITQTYAKIAEDNTIGINFIQAENKTFSTIEYPNVTLAFEDNKDISFAMKTLETDNNNGSIVISAKTPTWVRRIDSINEIIRQGSTLHLLTVKFTNGETNWINIDTGEDTTEESPLGWYADVFFVNEYNIRLNGIKIQILTETRPNAGSRIRLQILEKNDNQLIDYTGLVVINTTTTLLDY